MEHPTGTDHSTAARLKEQLEQMDETAFDESVFRDYLRELGDTVEPEQPIDVQASLRDFEQKHAVLIAQLDRQAQSRKAASRSAHRRRLGYRLLLIAAAVAVLNAMCIAAFGRGLGHYTAKWGSETFGFFQGDDFETSSDGKMIYYPDGRIDDRTDAPDYDHETYTALPENDTTTSDESGEMDVIDMTQMPVEPDPEFANVPDTDLSGTGLQKTDSVWDDTHRIESFDIVNADLPTILSKMGIIGKMAPTKLPEIYKLRRINVLKDYFMESISIAADYPNIEDDDAVGIMVFVDQQSKDLPLPVIEKDDRPVIQYERNSTTWYIMHNLQHLNAVALINDYMVSITGDIEVDEMKSIIDSIYA